MSDADSVDIGELLGPTEYDLTLFSADDLASLELTRKGERAYVKCLVTDRLRLARPEELVRQLYIHRLIDHYGYPRTRIQVEKSVFFGSAVHKKAADIVVSDRAGSDLGIVPINQIGCALYMTESSFDGSPQLLGRLW